MNCQETKTNFDERLDGRLDAARNAAFDAHVNHCPDCAAQWRAFAGAWNALAQQTVSVPSTGFADRMLRQLDETAADRPVLWLAPLWRWALAVGLVVALAGGGWFGWQRTQDQARKADAQVEMYALAQQDRLEDFDVIASLHLLTDENDNVH